MKQPLPRVEKTVRAKDPSSDGAALPSTLTETQVMSGNAAELLSPVRSQMPECIREELRKARDAREDKNAEGDEEEEEEEGEMSVWIAQVAAAVKHLDMFAAELSSNKQKMSDEGRRFELLSVCHVERDIRCIVYI